MNSPFNPVDETGGELPFWQQQAFFDQLMSAGRWLLVLIVAWLLWRRAFVLSYSVVLKPKSRAGTEERASGRGRSG